MLVLVGATFATCGPVPAPGRDHVRRNRRKTRANMRRIEPATFTAPRHLSATITNMRVVILIVGIFVYVAADLSVNNGASFGGWIYSLATLMRSSGVM
jgi:hypothetical protein